RHPEAVTRSVGEPALQILGRGECHGVDEQVELPAEGVRHLAEDAGKILVGANIARGDERARDRLGELADVSLDPLSLEGEAGLRAFLGEPLGDRPGDRAPVGDAEHEAPLPLERHGATLTITLAAACGSLSSRGPRRGSAPPSVEGSTPTAGMSSASRGARRPMPTSTSLATSPTAPLSRRSQPGFSSATRGSTS